MNNILIGVNNCGVDWGDYDNDGDLDILLVGNDTLRRSKLYNNLGSDIFVDAGSPTIAVNRADIKWFDYDNDNDLDILVSGYKGSESSHGDIYRNDRNGIFTPIYATYGRSYSSVDWGDLDNDGDLDFVQSGLDDFGDPDTRLMINEGHNTFKRVSVFSLNDIAYGTIRIIDYDNDGDLDISSTGFASDYPEDKPLFQLLRNIGNYKFEVVETDIISVMWSLLDWGDYDNDGDWDLLIAGNDMVYDPGSSSYQYPLYSKIYRNDGSENFTDIEAGLSGLSNCAGQWADLDNDGKLDIVLSGFDGTTARTLIYKNTGNDDFVQADELNGVYSGDLECGDYDNDGDLDILITGFDPDINFVISRIYRNENSIGNNSPSPPSNLSSEIVNYYDIQLSWTAGEDDLHPPGVLSYNVFIRNATDTLVAPMALENGNRLIPHTGNCGLSTNFLVRNLVPGIYFWSVQSIDNDWNGSPFAPEQSFEILDVSDFELITDTGLPDLSHCAFDWGDYDLDGDLDIALSGHNYNSDSYEYYGLVSGIFKNNGFGEFERIESPLSRLDNCDIVWSDIDVDGDLDLVLSGSEYSKTFTRVYLNSGKDLFKDIYAELPGANDGSISCGDIDNDGDPDLLITGYESSVIYPFSSLYENLGDGRFSRSSVALAPSAQGKTNFGDKDNDGDLDIMIVSSGTDGPSFRMYENKGNWMIEMVDLSTSVFTLNDASWIDYDNDGDLDIYLSGYDFNPGLTYAAFLARNDGNNVFTGISIHSDGIRYGSSDWGDYDNDGDLDLLMSGENGSGLITQLVVNQGNDQFEIHPQRFEGFKYGEVKWADWDNDGNLDFLIMGYNSLGRSKTLLYRNKLTNTNLPPSIPDNLSHTYSGRKIVLGWDHSSDDKTSVGGLTYNLMVYTDEDTIKTANALNTGKSLIEDFGNIGHGTTIYLNNIPDGEYNWKVQAIDPSFEASEFSEIDTFRIVNFIQGKNLIEQGICSGVMDWGDFDSDGDLDLAITGSGAWGFNEAFPLTKIFENGGSGDFEDSGIDLPQLYYSYLQWGDYNNDGNLDLFLAGEDADNNRIAAIYKNQGNKNFILTTDDLINGNYVTGDWGDMDNDGDLDLIYSGHREDTARSVVIFRNDGADTFTDIQFRIEEPTRYWDDAFAEFIDFDSDGDLDVFATGLDNVYPQNSYLYENTGNGHFESLKSDIVDVSYGGTDWGDYDNDGDPDLLISGEEYSLGDIAKIYTNFGNGVFIENKTSKIKGFGNGSCNWMDWDNDGDLDIIITGSIHDPISFYENKGEGVFTQMNLFRNFTDWSYSDLKCADVNSDGKIDLGIMGAPDFIADMQIYFNNYASSNHLPDAPTNLASSVTGNTVRLSWSHATDNETPQNGLSYNLYTYTTNDTIVSSSSHSNGTRKLSIPGNMGHLNQTTIYGLKDGYYSFKVQAIDYQMAGSAYSEVQNFIVCNEFYQDSLDFITGENLGTGALISFQSYSEKEITEYEWDLGDGTSSAEITPIHSYSDPGLYEVTLRVSNNFGCIRSLSKTIEITENIPIRIMNLITPNNDGKNDELFVEYIERYPNNEVRVTDLWGNEVFYSMNYSNDWMADYKGQVLPNGNYICTVKINEFDVVFTETITVLR